MYYKQALKENPKEIKALVSIGTAKFEKGRYEGAVELFQKALEQDDMLPDVHYDLANCFMKL